jgi:hypothetical protein
MVQIGKHLKQLYIIDFKLFNYSNVYSPCINGITLRLISFYELEFYFIHYAYFPITRCFKDLEFCIHNVILVINNKK